MAVSSINSAKYKTYDSKGNIVSAGNKAPTTTTTTQSTGTSSGGSAPIDANKSVTSGARKNDFTTMSDTDFRKTYGLSGGYQLVSSEYGKEYADRWLAGADPFSQSNPSASFTKSTPPTQAAQTKIIAMQPSISTTTKTTTAPKTSGMPNISTMGNINDLDKDKLEELTKQYGRNVVSSLLIKRFGADAVKNYLQGLKSGTPAPTAPTPATGTPPPAPKTDTGTPPPAGTTTDTQPVADTQTVEASMQPQTTIPSNKTTQLKPHTQTQRDELVNKGGFQKVIDTLASSGRGGDDPKAAAYNIIEKEMIAKGFDPSQILTELKAKDTPTAPESDIGSINEVTDYLSKQRDQYNAINEKMKSQLDDSVLNSTIVTEEGAKTQAEIIAERQAQAEESYNKVFETIDNLGKKAEELFDKRMDVAATQNMRRFAERGLLTDAQVGQSARFMLADYRANAELAKKELYVQQQELIANAIKDRQAAIDSLLAQKGLNENQKTQQLLQIQEYYRNNINQYTQNVININTAIDATVMNTVAKQIELDIQRELPVMQEEIKAQVNSEELKRIKGDSQLTREYIVRKMQELSPDLVVHAQYYLDNIIKSGDITKKPIEQLLSEVGVAAYNQFIAFNKITK